MIGRGASASALLAAWPVRFSAPLSQIRRSEVDRWTRLRLNTNITAMIVVGTVLALIAQQSAADWAVPGR
jgi:hypothetical protein